MLKNRKTDSPLMSRGDVSFNLLSLQYNKNAKPAPNAKQSSINQNGYVSINFNIGLFNLLV